MYYKPIQLFWHLLKLSAHLLKVRKGTFKNDLLKSDCNFILGIMTPSSAFHTILSLISWHPAPLGILVRFLPQTLPVSQ